MILWFKVCVWQDSLCCISLTDWMSFGIQQNPRLFMLIWFSQSSYLKVHHLFLCGESCYNDLFCRSGPGSLWFVQTWGNFFLKSLGSHFLSVPSWQKKLLHFWLLQVEAKAPIIFENKIHNILVKGKQACKIVRWNLRSQLGEKSKGLTLLKPRLE